MATAYGNDDEEAIDNLIQQIVPRTYSLTHADHADTQALVQGEKETEYEVHVTLFNPQEMRVVRVQVSREEGQWKAENLTPF